MNIFLAVTLIIGGGFSVYYQSKNPVKADVNLFNIRGYIFGGLAIVIGLFLLIKGI